MNGSRMAAARAIVQPLKQDEAASMSLTADWAGGMCEGWEKPKGGGCVQVLLKTGQAPERAQPA